MVRDGDIRIPRVPGREPLKEQVAEFVDCCLEGRRSAADGVSGRRVVAALEAATESLRTGGQPVRLRDVPIRR